MYVPVCMYVYGCVHTISVKSCRVNSICFTCSIFRDVCWSFVCS